MKKIAMIVIGGFLAVVLALVVVVTLQPAEVHVERSVIVQAQPVDIWPFVADLRGFVQWSPWEDRDPNQVTAFSEPSSGVGAWYSWKGNADVGSGKMSITAVDEGTRVEEDLQFIEPFASQAAVFIALEPTGDTTKVTWGFDTENDFMGKAFSLVVDMDAMLGGDFETGLARLAVLAQGAAKERIAAEVEAAERAAEEEAERAAAAAELAP